MRIIHIFKKGQNWFTASKDGLTPPQCNIESGIISPTQLFSSKISCVIFKLPSFLKGKGFAEKWKLLAIGAIALFTFKYYKFRIPIYLDNLLSSKEYNKFFFVGSEIGRELIEFHYLDEEERGTIFSGTEIHSLLQRNSLITDVIKKVCRPRKTRSQILIFNLFSKSFLEYILRKFPEAEIRVRYYDVMSEKQRHQVATLLPLYKFHMIEATCYDEKLSKKIEIPYEISKVNLQKLLAINGDKKYDISFIGALSEGRLKFLQEFLKSINGLNLRVHLTITNYDNDSIEGFLVNNKKLEYEKYLRILKESKATIDIWRLREDEGYSFRVSECMVLGVKVISNRRNLLNEKFYDPSRICIIQKHETSELEKFLNIPFRQVDYEYFSLQSDE